MKQIILFIALLVSLAGHTQTKQTVISVPSSQWGTMQALLYKPSAPGLKSLLVFLHGKGEAKAPLSNIYNNGTAGGPAYFIERGFAPDMFVLSPQAVGSDWSASGSNLDYIVKFMVANFPVDPTKIYLTGLSAGGDGILQYVGMATTYKAAAIVPMSAAHGETPASEVSKIVVDNVKVWGFGDPNADTHGYNTRKLVDDINKLKPAQANFTSYIGGHCCWNNFYNPAYKLNGQSIYDWMAQFSTSGVVVPPVQPPVTPPVVTVPPVTNSKTITLTAGYDNSIYIPRSQAALYASYDTIFISGNLKRVDIIGFTPKDTSRHTIFTNKGNVNLTEGVYLDGVRFLDVVRTPAQGRFDVIGHLSLIVAKGYGVSVENRSSDITVDGLNLENLSMGVHLTTFVYCKAQDSLNRIGGWEFKNFIIQNCTVANMFYEGMYISTNNTDNNNPNNLYKPEGCEGYYPEGMRAKNVIVRNNTVKRTGRGGIQLGAVDGYAIVEGNNVTQSGMNGNDAQGTNYSIGSYTHAIVRNNVGSNAFTNNLAIIGGSAEVYGNTFTGSFELRAHSYASIEGADLGSYDPATMPVFDNNAAALYGNQAAAIYVTTRANKYKDSSSFQVYNNNITSKVKAIWVEDGYGLMKKTGNCIAGQTNYGAETQIKFSTNCGSVPPVVVPPVVIPPVPTKTLFMTIHVYKDGTISSAKAINTRKVLLTDVKIYSDGSIEK